MIAGTVGNTMNKGIGLMLAGVAIAVAGAALTHAHGTYQSGTDASLLAVGPDYHRTISKTETTCLPSKASQDSNAGLEPWNDGCDRAGDSTNHRQDS